MAVTGVMVDAVYLRKGSVVVKGEITAIIQVHPRQHGDVVIVWTIDQQAATPRRRNINLAVLKGGPIMVDTVPRLPDRLQVAVGVVDEHHGPAQPVLNR